MNRLSTAMKSLISRDLVIAAIALVAIALHVVLQFVFKIEGSWPGFTWQAIPLLVALVVGGIPLVAGLAIRMVRFEFSSDLLAGLSIVTAVFLGEYLAGTLVVLMLSGGQALETYAVRRASSALHALARRMPSQAHRKKNGGLDEIRLEEVSVGDILVVFPHETCPVDAIVVEGRSTMDESYLTGEPYVLSKAVGSAVMSGAINGDGALTIRAEKMAVDSRYAKIMQVMRESEQRRPEVAADSATKLVPFTRRSRWPWPSIAWVASSDALRFLAVLVVATPCPLLIGIPVAIIGSISLALGAASSSKIQRSWKRSTLAVRRSSTRPAHSPRAAEVDGGYSRRGFTQDKAWLSSRASSVTRRHPLAAATISAADQAGLNLLEAEEVSERPGEGLRGIICGRAVQVTSRKNSGSVAGFHPMASAGRPGGWSA